MRGTNEFSVNAAKTSHVVQDHSLCSEMFLESGAVSCNEDEENEFNTWERVIVATEGNSIAGYCTVSEKDELPDEYDFTPFIGFVFVDEFLQLSGNNKS